MAQNVSADFPEIRLQFLGAAGTVTGSRTLLTIGDKRYLIDCGLFQGDQTLRQKNWNGLQVPIDQLDAVLLTHAHLDHSGYLPRLYQKGYRGPVYCSEGTADLCQIMLRDAAFLEEELAAYANRTRYSRHVPALPLFTAADAEGALELLQPHKREQWLQLSRHISCRFLRAGHIIGASMIQFAISTTQTTHYVTFSGDIGNDRSHIMREPDLVPESQILVLESTYGDRLHSRDNILESLAVVVNRTVERGGVLVIPAFAVGRAQELLYLLRELEDQKKIRSVPVILDSPMAVAATDIFLKHKEDHLYNPPFEDNRRAFLPRQYKATKSADESMLACMQDGPFIVLSAAGMLSGGRILHHLKARLPDPNNTVLFSGYQAEGTKGRFLQDNVGKITSLRIHHQEVPLAAEVVTLESLSAHGDYQDMLEWLKRARSKPQLILLNHGSPNAMKHFAGLIKREIGCKAEPILQEREYIIGPQGARAL